MISHIPHHIIFIHGIGDKCNGFSLWLQKKIKSEFIKTVLRVSSDHPPKDSLHLCEALWYQATQEDQDKLWDDLFPWMRKRNIPKKELVRSPISLFSRLRYMTFLRKLVVNFQGDLIAYLESPGANKYHAVHREIYRAVETCAKQTLSTDATPHNPALLTVVGHSLGAVIASDLLYDTLIGKTREWPPHLRLANLMSLGSPLALYKLRYGSDSFHKPIIMQDQNGRWINFYDPQDVIGYPLKTLNDAYDNAVFLDKVINVGQWWNPWHFMRQNTPFNHDLYLEDHAVAKIIGRKAGLDWLWTNNPEQRPELKREYDNYDQWVQKAGD